MFDLIKRASLMFTRREPNYEAHNSAMAQQQYNAMREAIARETPEQTQWFYLEVAAQLGNESAARRLAEMRPDPEKATPN